MYREGLANPQPSGDVLLDYTIDKAVSFLLNLYIVRICFNWCFTSRRCRIRIKKNTFLLSRIRIQEKTSNGSCPVVCILLYLPPLSFPYPPFQSPKVRKSRPRANGEREAADQCRGNLWNVGHVRRQHKKYPLSMVFFLILVDSEPADTDQDSLSESPQLLREAFSLQYFFRKP